MSNFSLYNKIELLNNYENLDAQYGPYQSKAEANTEIPQSQRKAGKTVGIIDTNTLIITEYWWRKDNALDNELEKKGTEVDLSNYLTQSEIQSFLEDEGYATKSYVQGEIENINVDPTVESEIQATVDAGAISVGDTVNEGTTLTDFAKQLLYDVYSPTFTDPFLNLNAPSGGTVEERTTISDLSIEIDFNRGFAKGNDVNGIWNFSQKQKDGSGVIKRIAAIPGGHSLVYTDFQGNTETLTNTTSNTEDKIFTIGSYKVKSGNNDFEASVTGVTQSSDTFLNSDGSTIAKPSVNSTYVKDSNLIIGKRRIFTGSPNNLPTNATDRRNMSNPGPKPFEGVNTINATIITTNFVILLPPGVGLDNVKTESEEDITAGFIETSGTVNVAAPATANDFTDYKEYIFTSDNPPEDGGLDITIKLN